MCQHFGWLNFTFLFLLLWKRRKFAKMWKNSEINMHYFEIGWLVNYSAKLHFFREINLTFQIGLLSEISNMETLTNKLDWHKDNTFLGWEPRWLLSFVFLHFQIFDVSLSVCKIWQNLIYYEMTKLNCLIMEILHKKILWWHWLQGPRRKRGLWRFKLAIKWGKGGPMRPENKQNKAFLLWTKNAYKKIDPIFLWISLS